MKIDLLAYVRPITIAFELSLEFCQAVFQIFALLHIAENVLLHVKLIDIISSAFFVFDNKYLIGTALFCLKSIPFKWLSISLA